MSFPRQQNTPPHCTLARHVRLVPANNKLVVNSNRLMLEGDMLLAPCQLTTARAKNMKFKLLAAIVLAASVQSLRAAPLEHGSFLGQPQISVVGGATVGCGIRILGTTEAKTTSDTVSGFDVSFMFFQDGRTLFKGLGFKPFQLKNAPDVSSRTSPYAPIKSFWLKSPGSNAAVAIGNKFIRGETNNSLLYTADFGLTVGLLETILRGDELRVAIHLANAPIERVYYGEVKMSPVEIDQIHQCLSELTP